MTTARLTSRKNITYPTILKISLIGLFLVGTFALIGFDYVSATQAPTKFTSNITPYQQVFEEGINPHPWTLSEAHGSAIFKVDREMTELEYSINLHDLENVIGINVLRGPVGDNGSLILAEIKATDVNDPDDYDPSGTLTGTFTDDDICPHDDTTTLVDCSVYGLVYEIINHRAYLQIQTDNNIGIANSAPGDLSDPGEIRGQLYPTQLRVFEANMSPEQQILDGVDTPTLWDMVDANGTATFVLSDDEATLHFSILLNDLANVVGIHIHNGNVLENNSFHLADILTSSSSLIDDVDHGPMSFSPSGVIVGEITDNDVCPTGHDHGDGGSDTGFSNCSILGLVHEIRNHRAYIQVHTDDNVAPQDTMPGDLFTPGEIRGQIYPKAQCNDCVVNTSNQILTIFKFETADMPFLADAATFLITPNPYSHNLGPDLVDPQRFGVNLIVTDNDPMDYDPMLGVIELVGVNPGTYSVLELKGPPGFQKTDEVFSSHEIIGEGYPHVHVTNIAINVTAIDGPIILDAPDLDDEDIELLETFVAEIGGVQVTSADQIPASQLASEDDKLSGAPPQHIEFSMETNSNWESQERFDNLGIPKYQAPTETAAEDAAFIPPVFKSTNDDGSSSIMSPILDEISAGTEIVLRLDETDVFEDEDKKIQGITLPMDVAGDDVGIDLQIHDEPPASLNFDDNVADASLFFDFDTIGDVDFSDPSVFSEPPTIDFTLPTVDGSLTCPSGVQVFLLDDDTGEWNAVEPAPVRNAALDTATSCGYTQTLEHFSSYVVGTGSSGGTSGGSSGGGHGAHSHGAAGGAGTSSDGTSLAEQGLEQGRSFGYYIEDGVEGFYTTKIPEQELEQAGILDDSVAPTAEESGVPTEEFEFGGQETFATIDVIEPQEAQPDVKFGGDFEGTKMIAEVFEQKFPIKYDTKGEIYKMTVDEKTKSVSFDLNMVEEGELTISVPRSLIDAEENNFIVLVTASPASQVDYEIVDSDEEFVTLKLQLPKDAKSLTVIGTKVVPEYGVFAILIFVIAISAMIVLSRRTGMNMSLHRV